MTTAQTPQRPVAASAPVRKKLTWRQATVSQVIAETKTARTLVFDIEGWGGHLAGQHVDLRLTADDGYQATRSYSLSSGPTEAPRITVERVDDGEVSPYLVDVIEPGDQIELRGPIGGYFVWDQTAGQPLLIGGGSGIAPLRAMWRARADHTETATKTPPKTTVLYSAQTLDRVIFADELTSSPTLDTRIHLTRASDPAHHAGRIGAEDLQAAIGTGDPPSTIYVCGPTAFVETVARHLVDLAVDPRIIRTERFG